MEYAKDIIYNLKYDRLVSKNKSRTGKLIKTIKENKLIILSILLLIGLIAFDYVLIKNDQTKQANIVKEITVEISYMNRKGTQNVQISTYVTKE